MKKSKEIYVSCLKAVLSGVLVFTCFIALNVVAGDPNYSYEDLKSLVYEADGDTLEELNIVSHTLGNECTEKAYQDHWNLPKGEYYQFRVNYRSGNEERCISYLINKKDGTVLYCSTGGLFFAEMRDNERVTIYEYILK